MSGPTRAGLMDLQVDEAWSEWEGHTESHTGTPRQPPSQTRVLLLIARILVHILAVLEER